MHSVLYGRNITLETSSNSRRYAKCLVRRCSAFFLYSQARNSADCKHGIIKAATELGTGVQEPEGRAGEEKERERAKEASSPPGVRRKAEETAAGAAVSLVIARLALTDDAQPAN